MIVADEKEAIQLPLWFVLIVATLFGWGCASTEETKVCFMKPFGLTEQGYTVAAVQCMTPEAFADSQK